MKASASPGIHHLSLNRCYLSIIITTSTSSRSPFAFTSSPLNILKPHNSLQTNNEPTRHSPQSPPVPPRPSPLHSKNSTPLASVPSKNQSSSDPELREVLQLATNFELFELQAILFGPSYFSPLLKSIPSGAADFDPFMVEEDFEEREQFIRVLESRFLFLAADARSTLRGWRPSYRNVLLDLRKELNIPCSRKLSTEDLEVEIFIHLVQESSRDWNTGAALRVGAAELCSILLKGGQLISLLKISQLVTTRFSGKLLLKAAKHKIEKEVMRKGSIGSTSSYLGFRSMAAFFGPILWGTFLADVVIQMLGTDYTRVLQAVYTVAQIRILRRHGLHLDRLRSGF